MLRVLFNPVKFNWNFVKRASSKSNGFKNEKIPHEKIQLIKESGENVGIVLLKDALTMFDSKSFDLVMVSASQHPPVCRIISRKAVFDKQKQPKRKPITTKELEINSNIANADLMVKINHAKQFFKRGSNVKFTCKYNGTRDLNDLLKEIEENLGQFGKLVSAPTRMDKRLVFTMQSLIKL
jgi:translation initiation factor IF-3